MWRKLFWKLGGYLWSLQWALLRTQVVSVITMHFSTDSLICIAKYWLLRSLPRPGSRHPWSAHRRLVQWLRGTVNQSQIPTKKIGSFIFPPYFEWQSVRTPFSVIKIKEFFKVLVIYCPFCFISLLQLLMAQKIKLHWKLFGARIIIIFISSAAWSQFLH